MKAHTGKFSTGDRADSAGGMIPDHLIRTLRTAPPKIKPRGKSKGWITESSYANTNHSKGPSNILKFALITLILVIIGASFSIKSTANRLKKSAPKNEDTKFLDGHRP